MSKDQVNILNLYRIFLLQKTDNSFISQKHNNIEFASKDHSKRSHKSHHQQREMKNAFDSCYKDMKEFLKKFKIKTVFKYKVKHFFANE